MNYRKSVATFLGWCHLFLFITRLVAMRQVGHQADQTFVQVILNKQEEVPVEDFKFNQNRGT